MSALVLVVGDGPRRVQRARRMVESVGADILVAADTAEAMRLFALRSPELTVILVRAADGMGAALCRKLRTLPVVRRCAILVVAPRAMRPPAFEAGCDAFVDVRSEEPRLSEVIRRFLKVMRSSARAGSISVSP
jgi:CheY-like chemotaxis protein